MSRHRQNPEGTEWNLPLALQTRRQALRRLGTGLGVVGLAGVLRDARWLAPEASAASLNPLAPRVPHFA
ncbi:MAG: hypothetical protein IT580_20490, partial [Verrucomicrobiales bacterium]|nr:hypothetical protein [Verrucomicrobiales bacterium]